jgi:heterodisulfide reductase subunit C
MGHFGYEEIDMQETGLNRSIGTVTPPSGELAATIHQCYQCGKCSAGCPMSPEMDLLPHQLVLHEVFGNVEPILKSKSIWLCLTCHTCGARCPNGIDVPALLDPIRHQVLKQKIATKESTVPAFHTTFMDNIRRFGRVNELFLIGIYKMKTKTYFNDMELGWKMFRRGKIHLLPRIAKKVRDVAELFKAASSRS